MPMWMEKKKKKNFFKLGSVWLVELNPESWNPQSLPPPAPPPPLHTRKGGMDCSPPSLKVAHAGNTDLRGELLETRGVVRSGSGAANHRWWWEKEPERVSRAQPGGIQLHHRRGKPHQSLDIGSQDPTRDWHEILPIPPGLGLWTKQLHSCTEPAPLTHSTQWPQCLYAHGSFSGELYKMMERHKLKRYFYGRGGIVFLYIFF